MIDHLSLGVSDLARSAAFYDAVLEPLGYRRIVDLQTRVGFGKRYPEISSALEERVKQEQALAKC